MKSIECIKCGSTMEKKVADHVYLESGMDHVILRNIPQYKCPECDEEHIEIERPAQLNRLLAEIIANKPARLIPSEVRFLRDHLGLTNRHFAVLLGVTESQASRWTTTDPMGTSAEYFLRVLATMGPVVLATDEAAKVEIGKMDNGKFVANVAHTIGALPSKDAEAKAMPMRFRRTGNSDWKTEALAAV
jgi:putative zinc finger/helix-turn-helix YgiT family protein